MGVRHATEKEVRRNLCITQLSLKTPFLVNLALRRGHFCEPFESRAGNFEGLGVQPHKEGYRKIIAKIFADHYTDGLSKFVFERSEIIAAKDMLAPNLDLNPGDVPYSFRYRQPFPEAILAAQPVGMEWIIEGAGRSKYRFKLVKYNRVLPRQDLVTIGIPDATPEIIRAYALDDEQALLAIVRYNRLIDNAVSGDVCTVHGRRSGRDLRINRSRRHRFGR